MATFNGTSEGKRVTYSVLAACSEARFNFSPLGPFQNISYEQSSKRYPPPNALTRPLHSAVREYIDAKIERWVKERGGKRPFFFFFFQKIEK